MEKLKVKVVVAAVSYDYWFESPIVRPRNPVENNNYELHRGGSYSQYHYVPCQLYITSNRKICHGDWYVTPNNHVFKNTSEIDTIIGGSKIEASTHGKKLGVPLLRQPFIEKFVSEKGFRDAYIKWDSTQSMPYIKDNHVVVSPYNQKFSRDEVDFVVNGFLFWLSTDHGQNFKSQKEAWKYYFENF